MRIDLNPAALPERTAGAGSSGAANSGKPIADSAAVSGEDVAHLTTGNDAVRRLQVHLESVPEVRQQRVESLQQAMQEGNFQISPQHIAGAMLSESNGITKR